MKSLLLMVKSPLNSIKSAFSIARLAQLRAISRRCLACHLGKVSVSTGSTLAQGSLYWELAVEFTQTEPPIVLIRTISCYHWCPHLARPKVPPGRFAHADIWPIWWGLRRNRAEQRPRVFAQRWWQKGAARMAEDHPTVNCEVVERSRKSLAPGPSDWMVWDPIEISKTWPKLCQDGRFGVTPNCNTASCKGMWGCAGWELQNYPLVN